MENERNQCRKCGGNAIPSKALMNYHFIDKSYHRGEKEFKTKLLDCLKCSSCGHSWVPIKSIQEVSQELALEWWHNLFDKDEGLTLSRISDKYYPSRGYGTLIDKEIEEIWRKECNKIEDEVFKPTQTQYSQKEVDKLLDEQAARTTAQVLKSNAKQFKEFNPELFKAYIDKFSNEDKYEALRILAESFGLNFEFNNSFTSMWNKSLE